MASTKDRNKLYARLRTEASFTTSKITPAIREYEDEGLVTITDLSLPYEPFYRVVRAYTPKF